MRNQCWASKPHVPVSDRGMSSNKPVQKWSKQQVSDWWGEDAITSHRQMSMQMFLCRSLSAWLAKAFLVREGHALMFLIITRIEENKGREHTCFVFHNLLQDICQRTLILAHLHWPMSITVLTTVTLLSISLGPLPVQKTSESSFGFW